MFGDKLLIWPNLLLCEHLEHSHSRQHFRSIHLGSCKSKKQRKKENICFPCCRKKQDQAQDSVCVCIARRVVGKVVIWVCLLFADFLRGRCHRCVKWGGQTGPHYSHLIYCQGRMQTRLPQHDRKQNTPPVIYLSIHFFTHILSCLKISRKFYLSLQSGLWAHSPPFFPRESYVRSMINTKWILHLLREFDCYNLCNFLESAFHLFLCLKNCWVFWCTF